MSPTYDTRYKRMVGGRACIGFRLNLRKLSIRRLRARFIRFFGFLKKRLFSKRSGGLKKRCESGEYCRMKSLGRTNSFYTEAIADCLEFIKRSSGASSLDISAAHHPTVQYLTSAPVCALNST